jgi:hypothetical protein
LDHDPTLRIYAGLKTKPSHGGKVKPAECNLARYSSPLVAFTAGVALWLAYGILRQEPAIIVWNAVTLALAAAFLAMKLKFG